MSTENKGVSIYQNWIEFISEQDKDSLTTEFLTKLLLTQKEGKFPESSNPKLNLMFQLYVPSFITNLERYQKKGNNLYDKHDVLIFNNWIEALIKLEPESVATNLLINIANILNGHSYPESGVFEMDVFLSHIQSSMAKTIANRTRKSDQPRFNLNPTNIQTISKQEPNNIQEISKEYPNNNQQLSNQYPNNIQDVSKVEPSNIQMPIGNRIKDIGNRLKKEEEVKEISNGNKIWKNATSNKKKLLDENKSNNLSSSTDKEGWDYFLT